MPELSYSFTHAIVRQPSDSSIRGLRDVDTGQPDLEQFRSDHGYYIASLRAAGVEVTELSALEPYPDAVFVEDVALCLPDCAVLLAPGAPTREGEVGEMREPLSAHYGDALSAIVEDSATIEGGDILVTEREVLIGLSARTNAAGAQALATCLKRFGHTVRIVNTPAGVLHFKSDCSLLDGDTILSTRRLAASGCFESYRCLFVHDDEEPAANAIRVNDRVLFPAGHPETARRLVEAGYHVHEVGNAEGARLDGGMSCLSLRFSVA